MSNIYISSLLCLTLNYLLVHGEAICRTYPGAVLGTCVSVRDCPRLNAVLGKSRGAGQAEAIQILRSSVCSTSPLRLCCETVAPEPLGPSRGLPSTCGRGKLSDFIVGGEDAKSWWPWMVLLVGISVADGSRLPFCGGTLINDRFVLTAAHCNDPSIILESARVGELVIGPDPDTNANGITAPLNVMQDIPVAEFITHPKHKEGCRRCNDIALLKLARPAKMIIGFVSPVCLQLHPDQVNDMPGEIATATGWGSDSTNPWNPSKPAHLQEVQLTIDETQFCRKITTKHPDGSVICAGAGDGKDTCRGDSGGPLMLPNGTGTRFFLVGISSFGPSVCGSKDTQGIYTNVHHYLSWIQETIR